MKEQLDSSVYTVSDCSRPLGVGWGEFYFTHRTDCPGLCLHPPLIASQAGFGPLVQVTHSGHKLPKIRAPFPDASPADIHHPRRKDQPDGVTQQRETSLSPTPWAPLQDHDPENQDHDLSVRAWPEGTLGSSQRSSAPSQGSWLQGPWAAWVRLGLASWERLAGSYNLPGAQVTGQCSLCYLHSGVTPTQHHKQ